MDLKCSGIMSEDPTACRPSDVVVEAARLMKVNDVGSVPVVDNNQNRHLVGILTDRDVAVRVVADARDANTTMVEDVMTRDLVTVGPDDDIGRAISAMEEHQVRRIPVVDGDGRLVGIIAQADIAARMQAPEKTAEVVERISEP
jgi:CBS domain-containing protein